MDRAVVRLELAELSPDGARFRLRTTFVRADGRTAATVTSTIGWLDLGERRLTTPPEDLRALVADLPRTDDFTELPPLDRR
jgi:acyl-CoA thioester hydrolase